MYAELPALSVLRRCWTRYEDPSTTHKVTVHGVEIGGTQPTLIAGPCAIESMEQTLAAAKAVRGVGSVVRYSTDAEKYPRHLVIHEMEHPDVHTSEAFGQASNPPRWGMGVNPYMYNTHEALYERML